MQFLFTASFERSLKRLDSPKRNLIIKTINRFIDFYESGQKPAGLGLKHLKNDYWEIRASIRDRIIFIQHKDSIQFIIAGSHDDIRMFLKRV
jgi:hypothetical protein